nr:hypothetical protein [Butyrivibrio sp.]
TSELYLDTTFYGDGGGVLSTTTDDAVLQFTNIASLKNTVESYLSSLEVGQIDVSAECEAIQDDCDKKERLDTLYDSFVSYVMGVNALNTSATDSFGDIAHLRYMFDFTRSYEYPDYKGIEKNTVLQRVFRAELHEMGITDEEIDNALNNSSFTLLGLTYAVELITYEDIINNNDRKEIMLFKSYLDGDVKNGLEQYGKNLVDDAPECWIAITKYHEGLLHIDYTQGDNWTVYDEGYDKYVNILNQMFDTKGNDKYFKLMGAAACPLAVKSANKAYEILKDCGYDKESPVYKKACFESDKTLMVYNNYIHYTEIDRLDSRFYDIGARGYSCHEETKNTISDIKIKNKEMIQEIDVTTTYTSVDPNKESHSHSKKENVTLFTTVYEDMSAQDAAKTAKAQNDNIKENQISFVTGAKNDAVESLVEDLTVGGATLSGAAIGSCFGMPTLGATVGGNIANIAIGIGKIIDDEAEDGIESISKVAAKEGVKKFAGDIVGSSDAASVGGSVAESAVKVGFDIYDVLSSYALVDEAYAENEAENRARLIGTSTTCIVANGNPEDYQVTIMSNAEVINPNRATAINTLENEGIAGICGFNEGQIKAITDELKIMDIRKYTSSSDLFAHRCVEVLQGKEFDDGYKITGNSISIDDSTNYTELQDCMNAINEAYNNACNPYNTEPDQGFVIRDFQNY